MTDVMNYNEQKVKLPSIKELTIGIHPHARPQSAPEPPAQPVQQQRIPAVVLPSLRASTSGSYSSESPSSRHSSISALPQYSAGPVVLPPHHGSPVQHYASTIQQQPVPAPQYVPRDVVFVPPGVMPPQHMYPPQLQHQHPQMMQPVMYQMPPAMHAVHPPHHPYDLHDTPSQPRKKRPRRKANEMVRLYACNYKGCRNSYGTLNHLNAHITFKRHGPKRKPEEFKQIRELYKLQKNLSEKKKVAGENGDLKTEESITLLANLSEKLIDSDKAELPVFHQQRGYNGYGRLDHTVKKDELADQLPDVMGRQP